MKLYRNNNKPVSSYHKWTRVMITLKRVYDLKDKDKGTRILVERLWPRGVKKDSLKLFWWAKDIAPSMELRKWFNHEDQKYEEFRERYMEELRHNKDTQKISEICSKEDVIFLYSASNEKHNSAIVLKEFIEKNHNNL